jgi:hypothetical protein
MACKNQNTKTNLAASNKNYLEAGDPVMLVGPGFLQLVVAKHLKRAGLKPIIVAPQKKLDSFFANILFDKELQKDSTIGMPETGDPYFGELKGVVFCAEDAILPSDFVSRVLDFTHNGKSVWADGAPARAICCLPVSDKVQKEKSNSWIPIFNNDRTIEQNWKNFEEKFKNHAVYKSEGGVGSVIRFGSLFGGSSDGPTFLKEENLALDEGMYKVCESSVVLFGTILAVDESESCVGRWGHNWLFRQVAYFSYYSSLFHHHHLTFILSSIL